MRLVPLGVALITLAAPVLARAETLHLDPSTGSFRAYLYKEGLLKALGHDHVVVALDYRGIVDLWTSSAVLHLEIDSDWLEIDKPEARAAVGLVQPIKDSDVSKILASMKGEKGLEVKRHPLIAFASTSIEPVEGEKGLWMVNGALSLHGTLRTIEFPVELSERPGGYWVSGYVRLNQSDYGIKPFSVAGGAVRVQDEVMVRFHLAAMRKPPQPR